MLQLRRAFSGNRHFNRSADLYMENRSPCGEHAFSKISVFSTSLNFVNKFNLLDRANSSKFQFEVRLLGGTNLFLHSQKIFDNLSNIIIKGFSNLTLSAFENVTQNHPSSQSLAIYWLHFGYTSRVIFRSYKAASLSISHFNFQEPFNKGDFYDGCRSVY